MRRVLISVLLVVVMIGSTAASASLTYTETKLGPGATGDQYGWSVAIDGDLAVVGAPSSDAFGEAYILRHDGSGGWLSTSIGPSNTSTTNRFGTSVAIDGNRIAIGAPYDRDKGFGAGAVYVLEPDGVGGWSQTKITASDGAASDFFGWSVGVSGNRIVVGSQQDDDDGSGSGSAYIYEPDGVGGWTETKLTASDAAANDFFGWSVAASGDRVVVGARGDNALTGSVYVYEPDGVGGWTESKLVTSDGASADMLGWSVAVSGPVIAAGAPKDDDNGNASGSVYVFESDGSGGWTETKLLASDGNSPDNFGQSVGVFATRVVVGAYVADGGQSGSGAVYVIDLDGSGGWTETKLVASDGLVGDWYGWSTGVSGDRVLVGAPFRGENGRWSGSAYMNELEPLNAPPDCESATASSEKLWPPNHKFREISISDVTDPDGDPVEIAIDAVFQDESVNGISDGNTAPDARGVGSGTVEVRAERSGNGNGRMYHVNFEASDGRGGACSGVVLVGVPVHKKAVVIDDGPLFDSTLIP